MSLIEELDAFISEMLALELNEDAITYLLLHEDTVLTEDGTLLETVVKRKVKRGGHTFVIARRGRPNPARSIKARQAARKGAAKRRVAQRNPSTKRKRMQAMRMRKQMGVARRPKKIKMKMPKVKQHGGPRVHRSRRSSFRRR
jgi:hypothetical protein